VTSGSHVALGQSPKVDPEARRVLEEVVAAYKRLDSYTDEGSLYSEFSIGESAGGASSSCKFLLLKPNKLRIISDEVELWDDGTTLTLAVSPTGKYHTTSAPSKVTLDMITEGPLGAILWGNPAGRPAVVALYLLLADDPLRVLRQGKTGLRVTDEPVGEKPGKCLIIESEGTPALELHLDPATKLVSRIEQIVAPESVTAVVDPAFVERFGKRKNAAISLKVGWKSGAISTRAPEPDAFTFKPPKGMTKVETP
jgi:hypothetical protein